MNIKNYKKTAIVFLIVFLNGFSFFNLFGQLYYDNDIAIFNHSINEPEYPLNIDDSHRVFSISYDKFNYAMPGLIDKEKLSSFLNLKGKVKKINQTGIEVYEGVELSNGYNVFDKKRRNYERDHILNGMDIEVEFTLSNILKLKLLRGDLEYRMENTISSENKILLTDVYSDSYKLGIQISLRDIYVYKYKSNGSLSSIDINQNVLYSSDTRPVFFVPKSKDYNKTMLNFVYDKTNNLTSIEKQISSYSKNHSLISKEEEVIIQY